MTEDISIHAPTRGATKFKRTSCNNYNISIHAPTRGATIKAGEISSDFTISIHAPTRGATSCTLTRRMSLLLFQSTLPRGERQPRKFTGSQFQTFQSTLPRGERRQQDLCITGSIVYFNPRSHEGSDWDILRKILNRCYFNPRSHEGSDLFYCLFPGDAKISIHAPTRGATATLTNFFFYNQSIFC